MSTFYRIAAFQAITATGNISITKPLTDSSSDNTIYLSDALPIGATELNKCDYVAILVDKEVIACTKANYDSTAKTMSSCIRGVSTEGGDITEQDTTIIKAHEAGTKISCPVIVQNMVQIQELINGEIATGANAFRVGDETDSDIYLYAQNADANKPYLRYNKTENKWYLSNDGTAENPIPETAGGEANASETVKGIVEIATQAEVDSGTTTGATWASLAITPDKLNPKNLTNTKATVVAGDSVMISDSEATGALKKTLFSTIKTFFQSGLTFLGLADTPASYSGLGGKLLRVNAAENAVESVEENPSGVGIDNTGRMVSVVSQFTLSTFVNIGSGFGNVSAGAGSGWANIPSVSTGNIYQAALIETGKIIEAEWAMKFLVNSSTPIRFSVGIGQQATYHSETTLSGAYGARFVLNGTGFYAVTSNNSTVTSVLINTLTHNTRYFKKFKIIYDLANNAKFYVDETLVATISTSLVANNVAPSTFGLALTGATGEVSCFFPVIRQTI